MANAKTQRRLPDWWEREKQRRLVRFLLFLGVLLALIGYFYYTSANGVTGLINGVNFDTSNYIAFVREKDGHFTIYAIRADGSGEHALTAESDVSDKSHPVWTMDGKSVLYASNRNDSKVTQIYILGNGEPRQLTYGTGNKSYPIVSLDGSHAAFISQGAIKSVYLNGKEVVQLMPPPRSSNEGSENGAPTAIDPTGAFLSAGFASDGYGVAGVQDMSSEASLQSAGGMLGDQAVTALPTGINQSIVLDSGHEASLAWEPHGNRLATAITEHVENPQASSQNENSDPRRWLKLNDQDKNATLVSGIRIWTFNGAKPPTSQNLFIGFGYSIEPKNIAWSPDGAEMAFEGWRLKAEGQRELGGIVVMKVAPNGDASQGVKVDPDHVNTVQYMVPAGANGKPLNPRWSPDSRHLLYEMAQPNGKRDLWVINTDGTNPINLTKGIGDNFEGAWTPSK